jgi:Fic family protein
MNKKLDFESATHQRINQLISTVDTFKGSWKILEQNKAGYLKELKKIATIESIGSSTRIEGATLTDAEVEKLLRSVKITKLITRDQQEVIGYYEVLQIILDNHEDIPLTERYIHQLHGMLLKHSNKDQSHKGKYKILSNQVVANYPDGSQRIIFRTTEPALTAKEMEALLIWTEKRLKENDLHPLLIVAAFVYEFLSIHPYQDGNGRLSRLLTTLLLIKLEYPFIQYVSFEHVIESRKDDYYRALMDGQKNRYKEEERIEKWVLFFLESLIELTKRLEDKYETYSKLKVGINERQQKILAFVKKKVPAQINEIREHLAEHPRNTIKKDLAYLVNEGLLTKVGAGRGVRYYIKK